MSDPQPPVLDVPTAVDEVIRTRRTSLLMDPDDEVPAELVDLLIELATWAPNHKRTWPWRFTVVTGTARHRLGEALAAVAPSLGVPIDKVAKLRTMATRSWVPIV